MPLDLCRSNYEKIVHLIPVTFSVLPLAKKKFILHAAFEQTEIFGIMSILRFYGTELHHFYTDFNK